MPEKRFRQFLSLYRIITGIMLLVNALCLAGGCLYICFSGDKTFSQAKVAEVFSTLAVPFFITIAAVIGGFVLHLVAVEKNSEKTKGRAPKGTSLAGRHLIILRFVLLILGAVLFLTGLLTGGTAAILTKAVNICSECIGLG